MQQLKGKINDIDTHGPIAMCMAKNRAELITSFDKLNETITTMFHDLVRTESAIFSERLVELETENNHSNVTERSNTVRALYQRTNELSSDVHELSDVLQAADNRIEELERQVGDLGDIRQQNAADNETRISCLVSEKLQLRGQLEGLQASFNTLSVSAGSTLFTEHLQ